jgi:hypothetical protein
MAAVQFIVPYPVVALPTNVGAPGAKAYFYSPGTTTPKAIYTSSALSTLHANPAIADGAGRFDSIYLDGTTTYALVITDKNDAVLYSQDPYTPGTIVGFTITAITSSSPSAGVGYATGAGGAVTQATNKSTAVTLNTVCGQITMNGAALAASTSVGFTLNNSAIATTDVVVLSIDSGATANSYVAFVDAVGAGSCHIHVRNVSAGSLSEAIVISFAVIKAVTS